MLRTLGIPTLNFCRYSGVTEGVFADHFRNIGISTFHFLHLRFHYPHFIGVLEQPLRARVAADDAFPALGERNLAPRPTLGAGQHHIDERAPAGNRAPAARRLLVGSAGVLEGLDGLEAAEPARRTLARPIDGAEGRADSPGFTGLGVDHHLRARHLGRDEINLRLDYREVAVSAAL